MKITLPLPPNMANSRMHWRVKHKAKKEYFGTCDLIAFANAKTVHPMPEPVKVRAVIYCGGRMDHDNAIARLKWPIDWMVENCILEGDKPSQLSWHWPIEQVVKRNQQYRVEFELEAA